MLTLLGMPAGAEWLVILAIVVLLFGSAKLPALVKQLGKSKKIWEEEVSPSSKAQELTEDAAYPSQTPLPQVKPQPAVNEQGSSDSPPSTATPLR
ncbi:twin-arginine translocase TatA/TatE family subunit [Kribbella sp. NPDC051587]|uniref:twin-arginine translocase TatA/TatE family subunit n=1 Tax=Kribbella sp. NPDC051587 TaxID=3364119 RepID=UPI0037B805B4